MSKPITDFFELLNLEAFDSLVATAQDNKWREIRIYVRKDERGKAEIRFDPNARIVELKITDV